MDERTGPPSDTKRRVADTSRWPVLARLPDVTTAPLAPRPSTSLTPGAIEYRFDPPQTKGAGAQTAARPVSPEQVRNPQSAKPSQPHAFDRRRTDSYRRMPRRESPILPRSNPFSSPTPSLIDTLAPMVRFMTMVVLFTAAGTWFQMKGRQSASTTRSMDPTKTASQPAVAPAKNAADHTLPAPTAIGPIDTAPEMGARVGRANGNDFAQKNQSAGPIQAIEHPSVTPPHFLVTAGSHVPRVQTSELPSAAVADNPSQADEPVADTESEEASVARIPGFQIVVPNR